MNKLYRTILDGFRIIHAKEWPIVLLLFLSLFICYSNVLLKPYAFTDDYSLFNNIAFNKNFVDNQQIIASGRPLYALFLNIAFSPLTDIGDLRYIRLIGIFGIFFLACSVTHALRSNGWEKGQAALLAFLICTLPTFQVFAAWATTAFFPYSALVAGIALYTTEKAYMETSKLRQILLLGKAVIFIVIALTIYQPTAMFFWVFASIFLLNEKFIFRDFLRRFLLYVLVMAAGLVIGFFVWELGKFFFPQALGPERSELVGNIVNKILWFFKDPLVAALNLHNITPSLKIALGVSIFMGTGLFYFFKGPFSQRFVVVLILLSILPLSYMPNLAASHSWASYRSLAALAPLIVLYIVFVLKKYLTFFGDNPGKRFLISLLFVAALYCSIIAHRNLDVFFIYPQMAEANMVRRELSKTDLSQTNKIYFVMTTWKNHVSPSARYDEFGTLSTSFPWASEAMGSIILREMRPMSTPIPVIPVSAESSTLFEKKSFVLNMKKILEENTVCELIQKKEIGDKVGEISCAKNSIFVHPGANKPSKLTLSLNNKYNKMEMIFSFRAPEKIPVNCRDIDGEIGLTINADGKTVHQNDISYKREIICRLDLSNIVDLTFIVDKGKNGPDCDWFLIKDIKIY